MTGSAKQGVDYRRNDGGVKPEYGRKAREQGISHPLRNQHDRDDEPSREVPWQIPRVIAPQPSIGGDDLLEVLDILPSAAIVRLFCDR